MSTFASKVIAFNSSLSFSGELPKGIRIMNPFKGNNEILKISSEFYTKFYSDHNPRRFIIGINPGRLGAGVTGVPFTDTKRLSEQCGIEIASFHTHEPSSVFVYELIKEYGGVSSFYNDFYINSICPLGFIRENEKGNWINCNYYDYKELYAAMKKFMVKCLREQIGFGLDTGTCYVLGQKNAGFLHDINNTEKLFDKVEVLDHPRYIVQYKARQMPEYAERYAGLLKKGR